MVAALGIAASLLSDVGFKALKSLTSGKSSSNSTQAGITDQSAATGQNVPGGSFGTGRADVGKLFSKIDSDGDGSISKDEFIAFKQQIDSTLSSLLKTQEDASKTSASTSTSADTLFSKFDANGDGSLSKDELQSVLSHRHHHHKLNASDQANAAAAGNSDGSGQDKGGPGSPAAFLSALLDLHSSTSASA
jgi:hypothetical protein